MRALIIAGGTLGHIKPSLEIAEVLKKQKDEVIFVTTSKQKGYIENKGFKAYTLNAPYTKRLASFNTIKFPLKFINSYINSKRLLRKINPDVIISLGSYLSIPIILNSKKRIPLFLCEQNVLPGKANKFAQRYARAVFTSFEESKKYFSIPVYNYGNPLSKEFFKRKKTKNKNFTILIFGGTNGAEDINKVIINNLRILKNNKINIIHITGNSYFNEVNNYYKNHNIKTTILPFTNNILSYYNKADLVICRAGSSSLFELSALEKPSIIIPHPNSKDNHQELNSEIAKKSGFIIINSKNISHLLIPTILNISQKKQTIKIKNRLAKQDSAGNIVNKIYGILKYGN